VPSPTDYGDTVLIAPFTPLLSKRLCQHGPRFIR
jgi:hypothetical protein